MANVLRILPSFLVFFLISLHEHCGANTDPLLNGFSVLKIATLTSSVNRNEESQNSSTVRILPHSDLSLSSHLLLISSYFFFVSFRTLFCIKLRGRDGSRVQILPRNHRHHCLSLLSNILTLNIRFVARLSSAMDLRFGIFVILLIVTFIWQPTDSKDSGGLISITITRNSYRLLFCVFNTIVVIVIIGYYCGCYEF